MAEHTLVMDPSRLLWRTRGLRWDYTFLARPTGVAIAGWMNLFLHVFDGTAEADETKTLRGRLRLPETAPPLRFIAAARVDPRRVDFAGRPVQHYFLYLLPAGTDESCVPASWAEQLQEKLAGTLDAVFALERIVGEQPGTFSDRLLRQITLPPVIELAADGPGAAFDERPDFWAEAEKKTPAPSPTLSQRGVPGWAWALILLLTLWLLGRACRPSPPDPPHPELAPGATTTPSGPSAPTRSALASWSRS